MSIYLHINNLWPQNGISVCVCVCLLYISYYYCHCTQCIAAHSCATPCRNNQIPHDSTPSNGRPPLTSKALLPPECETQDKKHHNQNGGFSLNRMFQQAATKNWRLSSTHLVSESNKHVEIDQQYFVTRGQIGIYYKNKNHTHVTKNAANQPTTKPLTSGNGQTNPSH